MTKIPMKRSLDFASTCLWLAMDTAWAFDYKAFATHMGVLLVTVQAFIILFGPELRVGAGLKPRSMRGLIVELAITAWASMNAVWVMEDFIQVADFTALKITLVGFAWAFTICAGFKVPFKRIRRVDE